MANKRYSSVSEMLRDLSDDEQFNQEFDERIAQRGLIKHLIALRSAKDVSQADVAEALGVTQSRVSKIESGVDDDLRFGELKAYARGFNMDIELILADHDRTVADEVKYHAFHIKRLLDRLSKCAERDEGIAQGVTNFFSEAFINIVRLIQDSASKLPRRRQDGLPRICIQIQEAVPDDEDNEEDPFDTAGKKQGSVLA